MICKLDNNNYCQRHQKKHFGRELEIALTDEEWAEEYREQWDVAFAGAAPKVSKIKQAINFVGAAAQHVMHGLPTVSDEEYSRRLSICDDCQYCDKEVERWQCKLCMCYLKEGGTLEPGKARWADQSCPIKKWDASVPYKNSQCGSCGS